MGFGGGTPKSAFQRCGDLSVHSVSQSSDKPRQDQTVHDFAWPAQSNLRALCGAWRCLVLNLWHQCRGNAHNLAKTQSGLGRRLVDGCTVRHDKAGVQFLDRGVAGSSGRALVGDATEVDACA